MDRNRVLEKIKKALNLANNSAATPGEAAAALNSAQAMMRKYGVDEKELGAVGYGRETIRMPIQAGKALPLHIATLLSLIQKAFGVKAVTQREVRVSDASWTVNYFGPDHRVVMALYTHDVVYRAMDKGWAKHLAANPSLKGERGARMGFYMGWLNTIAQQITDLGMTDEERAGTELVVQQHFPSLVKNKTNRMQLDGQSLLAGRDAADGFRLHRPMGGNAAERLRLGS